MMQLSDQIKSEILQHAIHDSPIECCGLIAVVKGRMQYFWCENIAETPDEHFILDGWKEVEDQGEVIAIVHSHPTTNPEPSVADKVACEKSELPWFIVNPNTREWGYTRLCATGTQGSTASSCGTMTGVTSSGIVARTCIWTTLLQRGLARFRLRRCSAVT